MHERISDNRRPYSPVPEPGGGEELFSHPRRQGPGPLGHAGEGHRVYGPERHFSHGFYDLDTAPEKGPAVRESEAG